MNRVWLIPSPCSPKFFTPHLKIIGDPIISVAGRVLFFIFPFTDEETATQKLTCKEAGPCGVGQFLFLAGRLVWVIRESEEENGADSRLYFHPPPPTRLAASFRKGVWVVVLFFFFQQIRNILR